MTNPISQKLLNFLEKEKFDFSLDQEILQKNSRDTSLFKIIPQVVLYPKSKFEISKILNFVNQNKNLNITGRSGGTDMSGGAVNTGIILSFTKYLNKIIQFDKYEKNILVEPGVFYRDFEKLTLQENLILPSYPASKEICALGGIVANNSGGEKSLEHGKTSKYLEEVESVLANGEIVNFKKINEKDLLKILNSSDKNFTSTLEYKIYKEMYDLLNDKENQKIIKTNTPQVSKNSAGYNLWDILKEEDGEKYFDLGKLICGSQGTLAMISKAKLNLINKQKYSKMLLIYLKDLRDLKKIRNIVDSYNPESFESYDENTFKVAIKFFPSLIKNIFLHNKENKINIWKLVFSFWREIKMFFFFGIPKLTMIVEILGDDEKLLEIKTKICKKEIVETLKKEKPFKKVGVEYIRENYEQQKYWVMRRESFNLLRQKMKGLHTAPFIDDVVVKGEDLGEFLNELIPILNSYQLFYTIAGHVGDGNLHIIPLMNFETEKNRLENIEIIKHCSKEVYELVKKYKGSITGEHNDGLIRTPFLNDMYDEKMLNLFQKVKNIFDENNILNPGKKVPLDKNLKKEWENNIKYLTGF